MCDTAADRFEPIIVPPPVQEWKGKFWHEVRNAEGRLAIPDDAPFNQALLDWYELRAGLLCAEAVTLSAINRTESRGAHQRDDIPDASPKFERNQTIVLQNGELVAGWVEVPRISYTLEDKVAAAV